MFTSLSLILQISRSSTYRSIFTFLLFITPTYIHNHKQKIWRIILSLIRDSNCTDYAYFNFNRTMRTIFSQYSFQPLMDKYQQIGSFVEIFVLQLTNFVLIILSYFLNLLYFNNFLILWMITQSLRIYCSGLRICFSMLFSNFSQFTDSSQFYYRH